TTGLGTELVRLQPRLRAHARRRVGADAEDLVQETLLRALQHAGTFQPGRAAWPWLRTIADRVAHRSFERDAREPGPSDDANPAAPDAAPLDDRDEVEALLARLAPAERELVVSHYLDGRPVAGIARDRRAPVGTVKAQLHRVRKRLLVIAAGLSAGAALVLVAGRSDRQGENRRAGDVLPADGTPQGGVLRHAALTVEHVPVEEPSFHVVDRRRTPSVAPTWTVEGGHFLALGSAVPSARGPLDQRPGLTGPDPQEPPNDR
ncbi:MAG: RNA polymerase sigma factor, partial [Planctomycetota bacterium]